MTDKNTQLSQLTHVAESGEARMVDVSAKPETQRLARATGLIRMQPATLKAIAEKTDKLGGILRTLRKQGVRDPYLADVEVYHKAATWLVRHQEYFQANIGKQTLDVLVRGLQRALQLAQGESPWLQQRGSSVARGYRSTIDGSVQPFAVTFPV